LWELPCASGTILACTEEGTVFWWELREPGSQSACCCSDVVVKGKGVVGIENEFDDKGVGMENEFGGKGVVGMENEFDGKGAVGMENEFDGKGVVGMENEFNVVGCSAGVGISKPVEDDDGGMIVDVELDGGKLALDA
jgi:hypothetical protein